MTTIVWDGVTLASDSQEADDFIEPYNSRKLYRVKNTLVGLCGDTSAGLLLLEWLRDGELVDEKPKIHGALAALVVRPSGAAYEYGPSLTPMRCAKKTAVGTGRGPALGALLAGADAVTAVKIARRVDPNTGGRIQSLRLR